MKIFIGTLLCAICLIHCAPSLNHREALKQVKHYCKELKDSKASAKIQTKIDEKMSYIKKQHQQKNFNEEYRAAINLASECKGELMDHRELVEIRREIAADKNVNQTNKKKFNQMVESGNYLGAKICAYGLLLHEPYKCSDTYQPSLKEISLNNSEINLTSSASSGLLSSTSQMNNRMAVSIGIGFGTASMDSIKGYGNDLNEYIEKNSGNVHFATDLYSKTQFNGEIAFRYYFPYYLLLQAGLDVMNNSASTEFSENRGTIKYNNITMEIPILAGAHYALSDTFSIYGAFGPSFLIYSRSFWSSDIALPPDMKGKLGIGVHLMTGLDIHISKSWALGLDFRYRHLKSGDLQNLQTGDALVSGDILTDDSMEKYNLDISGVSMALQMRYFIF